MELILNDIAISYESVPASVEQEGIWLHSMQSDKSSSWNGVSSWDISGKLDFELFKDSIHLLINQNIIYKTSFEFKDNQLLQKIWNEVDLRNYYKFKDISDISNQKKKQELNRIKTDLRKTNFDLSKVPLLRFYLVKLDAEKYVLFILKHHIISDALSTSVLSSELFEFYRQLSNGDDSKTKKESVQYSDYAQWQYKYRRSEEYADLKRSWQNKIDSNLSPIRLPVISDKKNDTKKISVYDIELSEDYIESLKNYTFQRRVVYSTVFLSAYYLLLYSYSRETDLTVGIQINGRYNNKLNIKNTHGIFANKIPLQTNINLEESLKNLVRTTNGLFTDVFKNNFLYYEDLIRSVNYRDKNLSSPLFNVMFNYIKMNPRLDCQKINDVCLKRNTALANDDDIDSQYLLSLRIIDNIKSTRIRFLYDESILDKDSISTLCDSYVQILDQLVAGDEKKVNQLKFLVEYEKKKLLYDFNDTKKEFDRLPVIPSLKHHAVQTPSRTAVKTTSGSISYQDLNVLSDYLCGNLKALGIRPGDTCAVLAIPSVELILSFAGIIKAGGVYLPIDPEIPFKRIENIVSDSDAKILLTGSDQCFHSDEVAFQTATIESLLKKNTSENPDYKIKSKDDPVYIIYTSGTTGKPKGVRISHGNILNYTNWVIDEFNITDNDKLITTSSFAVGAVYTQVFAALSQGAELHVLNKQEYQDPDFLLNYIYNNKVTFLKCTPSLLSFLVNSKKEVYQKLNCIKTLMVGGEKIKPKDIKSLMDKLPGIRYYNHYGATETTIGTIAYNITPENISSYIDTTVIGRPIYNARAYIIDNNNKMVPIGVYGELCIAGDGIGLGYINNEVLTNERFFKNPYIENQRIYKTGDIARWLPGGLIELTGRNDGQIKISGYRIEKSEIESVIANYKGVKDAIINPVYNSNNEIVLCAYFIADGDVHIDSLKKYLLEFLPHYMIPSFIYQVDFFPIKANNKIDIKSLPQPGVINEQKSRIIPPSTTEEKIICGLWLKYFKKDNLSVDDNFFMLGGHSLLAIQFISELKSKFNLVVELKDVFALPTIRELAAKVKGNDDTNERSIPKLSDNSYSLSSAQKRIYFLQQLDLQSTDYIIPKAYTVNGTLNVELFENAIRKVIRDNNVLRTSFHEQEDNLIQKINNDFDFKLEILENYDEKKLMELIAPIELNKAPLLKAFLVKNEDNRHFFLLNIHHIITDAKSNELFLTKVIKAYHDQLINEPEYQFIDYVNWIDMNRENNYQVHKDYWINKFKDFSPDIRLPYDRNSETFTARGDQTVKLTFEGNDYAGLKQLSAKTNTSTFVYLFALYKIVLSKFINSTDVVVGIPVDSRPYPQFRDTLGLFINTLAIRSFPAGEKKLADYISELHETILEAKEYQDYPFEDLVDDLEISRNINRNPVFDTFFNYLKTDNPRQENKTDFELSPLSIVKDGSKFDIRVFILEKDGKIDVTFKYNSKVLRNKTIAYLSDQYRALLSEILSDRSKQIKDYSIFKNKGPQQLNICNSDVKTNFSETGLDISEHTVLDYFNSIVQKYPQNIAVEQGDNSISYYELDRKSDLVTNAIKQKIDHKNSTNQPIVLLLEKSIEFVISVLGILKSGNLYVPLDVDHPTTRLKEIIKETQSKTVITNSRNLSLHKSVTNVTNVINIDDVPNADHSDRQSKAETRNTNFVYILSTSGSTGKPKLICQSQRNLLYYISRYSNSLYIQPTDKLSWLSNPAHDAAVVDIFSAVLNGATLSIYDINNAENYLLSLPEWLTSNKITIYHSVPTLFSMLIDSSPENTVYETVRYAVLGGERVNGHHFSGFQRYFSENAQLVNLYGSTEATISCMHFAKHSDVQEFENIPIGMSLPGMELLLKSYDNTISVYNNHEIVIKSKYLAEYVNDFEQSKTGLIKKLQEEREFATNDIVRLLEDGSLQFTERKDRIHKIKGHRVDLHEIEFQIAQFKGVNKSIAYIHDIDKSNGTLYGYFTTSENDLDIRAIENHLRGTLPEYMVPQRIIRIDKIPLTSSGKIQHKLLPKTEENVTNALPSNEIESEIARAIAKVLKIKTGKIYTDSNFFKLGGHSLKAIQLISIINKKFHVKLSLKIFYNNPTVSQLVKLIQSSEKTSYEYIKPAKQAEVYPASSRQRRLFALQELKKEDTFYNMTSSYCIHGKLDPQRLITAIRLLVNRHESFRTSFDIRNEQVMQKISPELEIDVPVLKIKENEIQNKIAEFKKAFDLRKAPLIRAEIYSVEDNTHYLLIDMHHIISDGSSVRIFLDELKGLYQNQELPELKIQYKDYAVWEQSYSRGKELKQQKDFWINQFKDDIPVLELLTDFTRPAIRESSASIESFILAESDTIRLKDIARQKNVTLYTLLLSVYKIFW